MRLSSSQQRILHGLKARGAQSVRILSQQLEMTPMGVRHHLADLQRFGLVRPTPVEKQHRGRPVSLWKLTGKGHRWFPNAGSALARELLQVAEACWGGDGIERLVDERTRNVEQRYRAAMRDADDSLERKVEHLVDLRSEDGYMAELRLAPDGWVLAQNHCPIESCATSCPHFCEAEARMFSDLLGAEAEIRQTAHLLAGDRRCAWHVRRVAAQQRAA